MAEKTNFGSESRKIFRRIILKVETTYNGSDKKDIYYCFSMKDNNRFQKFTLPALVT